LNSSLEADQWG